MQWRGRELTEESFIICSSTNGRTRLTRAGDKVHLSNVTHFSYIKSYPRSVFYRWPTERELIEHFGAQACNGADVS